jgi:hypothetical protein
MKGYRPICLIADGGRERSGDYKKYTGKNLIELAYGWEDISLLK